MPEVTNLLLLFGDAFIYFLALATLFRFRHRLGIGAFFCALGVMHFIETYLASIFYISLPLGIVASPGSTALFVGKLLLLLLVYIREDAATVRQPIYGLLFGNLLMVVLAFMMRNHELAALGPARGADFRFLHEMGALMVWGTILLFADCILMILAYERSRLWFGQWILPRLWFSAAAILTFDQVLFFAGLYYVTGAGWSVLLGGWIAKLAASAFYGVLVAAYLHRLERSGTRQRSAPRMSDVFDMLTYRERYEDLLARSGRDALTGALDRGRLETEGRRAVDTAALAGRPLSLLIIDIDHFKSFNDRFGHAAGDAVIKRIANDIMATVRLTDLVFRFGGEEFTVICDGLNAEQALGLGERIRRQIASNHGAQEACVTVSIGVAACGADAADYDALFSKADARLYQAKAAGRNCVIGERAARGEMPVRLVYAG